MSRRPKLVALRALGLGDLLTGVPALRALADAFPNHRRVLACPLSLAPLAHLTGAVDEIVRAAAFTPLPPELRAADVAVNLHGAGPESHRVLLGARPRRLLAYGNPVFSSTGSASRSVRTITVGPVPFFITAMTP